ncbi:tRNA-specific adenosine deaminase 2 [Gracilariopsis chorda]|uniref:tRNA-specific adenosine deaminase 2 n=1 Tax=Gracilariopsis chorda TaxID=448386 RepID=A0A2V3J3M3_9FLOR|nr:tRNA-specific adenosine deaminase 2 [Gracilariopsis chorda]|eukprot:PXF49056.1 tRNA-specific adenosine deaminase 2 [Gracilariopsis chorda]
MFNSRAQASHSQIRLNARAMEVALYEARKALERGEVPVGCVLVTEDGETVATGSNRTNERGNATSHAELVAFEELSNVKKMFKKGELTLYVTCEPCIMCTAAIVQMEVVGHIVYGCSNPRFGGCGSVRSLDLYRGRPDGHVPTIQSGVEAATAIHLLGEFYNRTNPHAPKPKKRRVKR